MTYFIGYGLRTNKGHDLNQADRDLFFDKLVATIEQIGGEVLFAGTGTGIWEGQQEPAGSITFLASIDEFTKELLRRELKLLAVEFEQDSIAFTLGNTELIEAGA